VRRSRRGRLRQQEPRGTVLIGEARHRGLFQGYHFGLEVKMPGRENTVTKHQQYHLDCIKEAGGISAVVTDPDEASRSVRRG
jgi:hypothetical protein